MIAIITCVKLLAVPGLTPGPCEAKAAFAQNKPATTDMAAKTKHDIRCLMRDDAMTISCDEKLAEDTDGSLSRF
jgi:hypothetical protein